jgi:predicted dehydrogenase
VFGSVIAITVTYALRYNTDVRESQQPLRVAVAGYGLAGSTFHAPLIAATPGLAVAGIVTSDPERQLQAASEYPGATVVGSVDEVWERSAEYDLVVVATPNHAHAPIARAAVDLGMAVCVDKPLATSAAEARELVAYAAARQVPLTVFQNRRWDSDQLTLRRLLSEGALGEVLRYESRFERWRPDPKPGGVWRETRAPEEGGGTLLDLGSHLVDEALCVNGPATHVYAEIDSRRGGAADDDAFLALRHANGAYSHLWASAMAAAPGPRLRVLGSRAAFVVADVDGQEDALSEGRRPGGGGEPWGREPAERWGRVMRGTEVEVVQSERGAWPEFYAGVERWLRAGGDPPVDPADAVRTLELIEAARRSAAAGSTISL